MTPQWYDTPPDQRAELVQTAAGQLLEARGHTRWRECIVVHEGKRVWVTRVEKPKEER